jgi:hypothetical protein
LNPRRLRHVHKDVRVGTVGILGFHLTFSSGLAYTVLVIEAVAVIMLGFTALLMPGPARSAG